MKDVRCCFFALFLFACAMVAMATCPVRVKDKVRGDDTLMRGNRDAVRLEDRDIALYVKRIGANTVRTDRGVHVPRPDA